MALLFLKTRVMSSVQTLGSKSFVLFVLVRYLGFFSFFANLHFIHNLLNQSIQASMQNLESLAQKMAMLPLDALETPPDKKIS